MHVNSMVNVLKYCTPFNYADDTCMLYSHKDMEKVEYRIQEDLNNIIKWSHDNGIILNLEKTKCMLLQSPYLARAISSSYPYPTKWGRYKMYFIML
jgi:hypothetical protein